MRYALITLLLAGCASAPVEHKPQRSVPQPIGAIEDRAYGWGFESGRRAARNNLTEKIRVTADVTSPCPPHGDGLVRDRPPTPSGQADEIERLKELYRYCATLKDGSDATILWILGEIRHGKW